MGILHPLDHGIDAPKGEIVRKVLKPLVNPMDDGAGLFPVRGIVGKGFQFGLDLQKGGIKEHAKGADDQGQGGCDNLRRGEKGSHHIQDDHQGIQGQIHPQPGLFRRGLGLGQLVDIQAHHENPNGNPHKGQDPPQGRAQGSGPLGSGPEPLGNFLGRGPRHPGNALDGRLRGRGGKPLGPPGHHPAQLGVQDLLEPAIGGMGGKIGGRGRAGNGLPILVFLDPPNGLEQAHGTEGQSPHKGNMARNLMDGPGPFARRLDARLGRPGLGFLGIQKFGGFQNLGDIQAQIHFPFKGFGILPGNHGKTDHPRPIQGHRIRDNDPIQAGLPAMGIHPVGDGLFQPGLVPLQGLF